MSVMEYPDSVYRQLAEGGTAYEKRVIINLAKVSRIHNADGSIRPFIDFKNDWEYTHSVYGETDTCEVCGKHPIVENCILTDSVSEKTIVVGNTCVHRYIDIVVDGVALTEDEKEAFLRENMNKAKAAYRKALWEKTHPDAWENLKHYEPWMTETYGKWKPRPTSPKLESLHRRLTNRLLKYGFPGPKMWDEWEDFLWRAPTEWAAWKKKAEVRIAEREEIARKRKEAEDRFEAALKEDRAKWVKDRDTFNLDIASSISNGYTFTTWLTRMFEKISRDLEYGMTLSPERQRLFDFIQVTAGKAQPPDAYLPAFLKAKNSWEKNFVLSIWLQAEGGKTLSSRQTQVLEGITSR